MVEIKWEENVLRQLDKLPDVISKRIVKKVDSLRISPFSKIKKLKGEDVFRLRIGDYRIILDVDVKNKLIRILYLGHRKNIYKKK